MTGMESEIRGAGEPGDPLHSMTEAAPHMPAQPACGHHEDRCLISDPKVRVPVSEDPSVALKPQAGLPPCGWVSACVSSPQISPNVSPCALIPGQPSCPPCPRLGSSSSPQQGPGPCTSAMRVSPACPRGARGWGSCCLPRAGVCHQGHVLSLNFCFYTSCRKQRLEIEMEAS